MGQIDPTPRHRHGELSNPANEPRLEVTKVALEGMTEPVVLTTTGSESAGPIIAFINPAFLNLTGYGCTELIGQPEAVLHAPAPSTPGAPRFIREPAAVPGSSGPRLFRRKNGREYFARVLRLPLQDRDGLTTFEIRVFHDICDLETAPPAATADPPALRTDAETQPRIFAVSLPDTTLIFTHERGVRRTETDPGGLIGRRWITFFDARDQAAVQACLSALSPLHSSQRFEARSILFEAPEVPVLWHVRGVFDPEGGLLFLELFGAAREPAESAPGVRVDQSSAFLEHVLNAIDDDVFVKDTDHRWVVLNDAACRLIGGKREDLIGRTDSDVFSAEQAALHVATDQEVLRSGRTISYEWVIERNGRPRTFLAKKSALTDAATGRRYVTGVARDITDLKIAEAKLFEEKERALVTLQSIDNGVIRTDPNGLIEYMNPVAETLTGWPSRQARHKPLASVFRLVDERTRKPALTPTGTGVPPPVPAGQFGEVLLVHRSGHEYVIEQSTSRIHGRRGETLGAVIVFRDVTERRRMARKLEHDAAHDALTGLVNRRQFESRLEKAVLSAKQFGAQHCLCYFDLDKFKLVNDTAGHAAGDALLKQIKAQLSGIFRDRDTFARLGGDEFGILLDNCPIDQALGIADIIVSTLRTFRFEWNDRSFQVGASVGVVSISSATESATEAMSQADVACYAAKEMGGGQVYVYRKDGIRASNRHSYFFLASNIQDALDRNAFCLYGQPVFDLSRSIRTPVQYEVLVRLLDGSRTVLPAEFIRPAERYGLMAAIDCWVIRTVHGFLSRMRTSRLQPVVAINLSGNTLNNDGILDFLDRTFTGSEIDPNRICFEVTETAAIASLDRTAHILSELKMRGFRLALDDFGSGLSSFAYLKHLPVDYLKIDGSFVTDMIDNAIDFHMVQAINEVGHVLGMRTIAECVENAQAIQYLSEMNVDMAQGYALGVPVPISEMEVSGALPAA